MISVFKEQAGKNDPYWAQTHLLIKNSGINGSNNNTFVDSSSNALSIARNGNASQGKYGPSNELSSGYFDGSGDSLFVQASSLLSFGSNDFTVEMWVNPSGVNGSQNYSTLGDGSLFSINGNQSDWKTNGGYLSLRATYINYLSSSGTEYSSSVFVGANVGAWTHYALVRQGNVIKVYINGIVALTINNAASNYGNSTSQIGIGIFDNNNGGRAFYYGYISLYRISKLARYTNNFTPSTKYGSDSNTILFLEFKNASIFDATGKNNIETIGSSQVSTSNSIYNQSFIDFNGINSGLSILHNSLFNLTNQNFTIEVWLRTKSTIPDGAVISKRANGSSFGPFLIWLGGTNGTLYFFASSNGTSWDISSGTAFQTLSTNTEYFVQIIRNGNTFYGYLNGVQKWMFNSTATLISNTIPLTLGYNTDSFANIRIIDFRLTVGVARPNSLPIIPFPSF